MSFKHPGNPCRDRIPHLLAFSIIHILWTLLPKFWVFLFILSPAGCSSIDLENDSSNIESTQDTTYPSTVAPSENFLDILTFNNDRLRRIDSHQRICNFKDDIAYVESTGGNKIIFFCTNARNRHDWIHANSYGNLLETRAYLEKETRSNLTRTGECRTTAGDRNAKASLKPLVSEIAINTISCNFSEASYRDKEINDVKAYLTNVSGTYPLAGDSMRNPERIINHGSLSQDDLKTFIEPDILYSELCSKLNKEHLHPQVSFLCFPNSGNRNDIGNPPTRLVIEGKIDGKIFYWPIDINPPTNNTQGGIERGCRYSYDICITRKGTTDPDNPINLCNNEIKLEIQPWKEKKEYGVHF